MGQQVSIGVMCLHIQVRKLSLLGIAVAGVYCCMGLRSVSIEPRLCLLLRSEPSIVNFNWQGSPQFWLTAYPEMKHHCFDRKKNVHARSFFCLIDASWWYHNQTWTGIGSKPDGSTTQITWIWINHLMCIQSTINQPHYCNQALVDNSATWSHVSG